MNDNKIGCGSLVTLTKSIGCVVGETHEVKRDRFGNLYIPCSKGYHYLTMDDISGSILVVKPDNDS
jgi:hypothetical protein